MNKTELAAAHRRAERDLIAAKEDRDAYRERGEKVRYQIAEEAVRYYERAREIYARALGSEWWE